MTGRSRIFLVLIVTAFAVMGCSYPMGGIGGPQSGFVHSPTFDGIKVVPGKTTYNVNDLFLRQTDLQVYTTYRGQTLQQRVPNDECEISIEDPAGSGSMELILESYHFERFGMKKIVVKYDDYSDEYLVEVRALASTDPETPEQNINGGGILIIWAK